MSRWLVFAFALLVCGSARAVDNSKHVVGAGIVTQFSGGRPPQLSAKFALQPRTELSLLMGLSTGNTTIFTPGAKFAWILIPEKHMNVYAAVGGSLDLRTRGGLNAFLWQAGPGVEVFFSEWPNLGFSLEFGVGGTIVSGGGSTPFGTATSGFGGAGIHYWF